MLSLNDYRHRVTLQKATHYQDAIGEENKRWSDVFSGTIPARVRPLQGRSLFLAQQVHANVSAEITIRYGSIVADLSPENYQFIFNSKIYDILIVTNTDEMNVEFVCLCKVRS